MASQVPWPALVLSLALLAAPTAAGADASLPGSYDGALSLAGGPVLGGDRVAWAAQTPWIAANEDDEHQSVALYSAPLAGGAPARLAQVAQLSDDGEYREGTAFGALFGSPGHLAWTTVVVDDAASKYGFDPVAPFRLWLLGAGGKPVALCSGDSAVGVGAFVTAGLSLAGDELGISGCSGAPGVNVRDLSRPGSADVALATGGGPVRLAGGYAAWRTSTGFEILDRPTGTATAIGLEHVPLPGPVEDFDVAPDGVLAVAGGTVDPLAGVPTQPGHPFTAWASPADPQWHVASVPGLVRAAGIRVRGGRIAVMTAAPSGSQLQLRLVALSGAQSIAVQGAFEPGFDFDGTSVAWAGPACEALVVHVTRADATAAPPVTHGCPVALDAASVRVKRRVAELRVHCPAPSPARATDVCKGTARAAGVGAGSFRVRAGTNGRARFTLTARAARTLARRHRLTVTLAVRSATRGHVSRSAARVVLRAG
jgi:hypothetical protein